MGMGLKKNPTFWGPTRTPKIFIRAQDGGGGGDRLYYPRGGGYPYFGHFLAVLGISGENGVPDWSPRGCKPAEKTVHHPLG